MDRTFTSESVSSGHPDKLCDAISDQILDDCITRDPYARVAVETLVKGEEGGSAIVLAGEVSLEVSSELDFEEIARKVAVEIGYTSQGVGMDARPGGNCVVECMIGQQSPDIAQGVDDDATSAELQVGLLPPLLEVDEEAVDASEVSPVSVVAADLSAVPAFGLK